MSAYDILFDPDAPADKARPLDLPEGLSVLAVADALDRLFASDKSVRFVLVRIGGVPLGVANRMVLWATSRGAPPTSLDECPECYAVGRHEQWCSAALHRTRRPVDPDANAHADAAAEATIDAPDDTHAGPQGDGT